MVTRRVNIGHGVAIEFTSWRPDRDLNPQYDGIPDVERYGLIVDHPTLTGGSCTSGITFDTEVARRIEPDKPMWTVESWEPLTLSPSLLCRACGCHGWIRDGKWVPA